MKKVDKCNRCLSKEDINKGIHRVKVIINMVVVVVMVMQVVMKFSISSNKWWMIVMGINLNIIKIIMAILRVLEKIMIALRIENTNFWFNDNFIKY